MNGLEDNTKCFALSSGPFIKGLTLFSLSVPLGTPYRISHVYEGKTHDYLPDFVGTFCDGEPLIAEAGRESENERLRDASYPRT